MVVPSESSTRLVEKHASLFVSKAKRIRQATLVVKPISRIQVACVVERKLQEKESEPNARGSREKSWKLSIDHDSGAFEAEGVLAGVGDVEETVQSQVSMCVASLGVRGFPYPSSSLCSS